MNFETIIGLEVHTQLLTKSKMFCRCSAEYADALPNTHVCSVCLGMPGVLPTINRRAIRCTIVTALALNCTVPEYTRFDRKNYPYPDLMKGYQISQSYAPLGHSGWINIQVDDKEKKVGIDNVHLEEDVAKLLHRTNPAGESYSLVDVNRAGMPLMEIVGDPDLRSPEEARQYLMQLRNLLQYLGVSTANMEEGSFRCDANISIRPEGSDKMMAKVEVKNMNSFRAVYRALEYEAKRQRKMAEEGKLLVQETRGWVEEKGKTVSQRTKEHAHDYRYFPEPDLAPLVISREWLEEIKTSLPESPAARRDRLMAENEMLTLYDANLLTSSKAMADYFECCLGTGEYGQLPSGKGSKAVSNWLLGEVSRIINAYSTDIDGFGGKVSPEQLCRLIALNGEGIINTVVAKSVLEEMYQTGKGAEDIIKERGLSQISDTGALETEIAKVVDSNAPAVADYKAGKTQSLTFLVGQIMKATRGRANPKLASELLKKKIEEG